MAFGDEIYSDESLEQRAKRMVESHERAVKVVQEALAKAQQAQDARDRLAEATAMMLVAICERVGAMGSTSCRAQQRALVATSDLRAATGRNEKGERE